MLCSLRIVLNKCYFYLDNSKGLGCNRLGSTQAVQYGMHDHDLLSLSGDTVATQYSQTHIEAFLVIHCTT